MTTQEVATKLADYCRQGKFEEAQDELYSADAESNEPVASPGMQSVKGLDKIKEKGKQFAEMVEAVHSNEVSEPVVAGNAFSVKAKMDVTMKGRGRTTMEEIAVYNVKDGKIVSEQFFY